MRGKKKIKTTHPEGSGEARDTTSHLEELAVEAQGRAAGDAGRRQAIRRSLHQVTAAGDIAPRWRERPAF